MEKLLDSRETAYVDEECDAEWLKSPEGTYDLELERMYVDKLKEQRNKIDTLTQNYELAREQIQQKQLIVKNQERRITLLTEQAAFKKKYQDIYRTLKQVETERERLRTENEHLRKQLSECINDRNSTVKEYKSSLKEADFQQTQELYKARQTLQHKQRIIDDLKVRMVEQARTHNDEIIKKQHIFKSLSDEQNTKIKHLEDEVNRFVRQLTKSQEEVSSLENQLDSAGGKCDFLQQKLTEKQEELQNFTIENRRLFQRMKYHIRSVKKQLLERQEEIERLRQELWKMKDANKKADTRVMDLTEELREQNRNHQDIISRAKFDWSQDKSTFNHTTRNLKTNIQDLVRTKNQLMDENDRLHTVVKHHNQIDKRRGLIGYDGRSEVDRIDRLIRRI